MYKVIKNYCENKSKNGLFLLDMPTGFGKTHSVLQYIFEVCQKEENKNRVYIFVTPLKKNLPSEDLRNIFKKNGKDKEFEQKFLFIDSNSEFVLKNYSNEIKRHLPKEIKESKEFRIFEQEIGYLRRNLDKDITAQSFIEDIENKFREYTEPNFRNMVQCHLKKSYSSVKERIYAIKNDKKWQWLGKLYPSVFTSERQILFMSIDKFILKNSPIVEPSYYFFNSNIIDNAVIFIDEFDSTKEKILERIIKDGLSRKIDSIRLFKSIYSALKTNEFPTILTQSSSVHDNLAEICEKAEILNKRYNLQFNHRTESDIENIYRNFLFQDYKFYSVLNGNKNYITSFTDYAKKINIINFVQKEPNSNEYNINSMLGEIRGFIKWFQGMVIRLADNYRQIKNEQRQDCENELTQEEAIRSVLDLFQLNQHETNYLINQIIRNTPKRGKKVEFDNSIYEKGFRYYCFENSAEHSMRTGILMYSYHNSPEKMLIQVCNRAKVIGISATATLPTVIGNFDLEYIQSKLQEDYYKLSDEEHKRLRQ